MPQMKFFGAISGKYQVRMRIDKTGGNNRTLRIYNSDAIFVSACTLLEQRFCAVVSTHPADHPIIDGKGRIWDDLQRAGCPGYRLLGNGHKLPYIANDGTGFDLRKG